MSSAATPSLPLFHGSHGVHKDSRGDSPLLHPPEPPQRRVTPSVCIHRSFPAHFLLDMANCVTATIVLDRIVFPLVPSRHCAPAVDVDIPRSLANGCDCKNTHPWPERAPPRGARAALAPFSQAVQRTAYTASSGISRHILFAGKYGGWY